VNEPFRIAAETYGTEFYRCLGYCHAFGEVHSDRRYFVMGWPIKEGFWIQFLAGDMRACIRDHSTKYGRFFFNRCFRGQPHIRSITTHQLNRHGKPLHAAAAAE
jgi:hypothetical protein